MDIEHIVQRSQDANLRLVRFLYCDNGGILRGKATHASNLAARMSEGIGQALAMQAFTGVETLVPVKGMEPVGEMRLVPDPETFVILPYTPNTGMLLCDMVLPDGVPWSACPRTFLKRMIAELAASGMRAEVGGEHEFYLARQEMGKYVPADQSLCYSSIGLDDQAEVIDAILTALEATGCAIELFHTELGPAQQELSLRHTDALRAADRVCLVRETVRGVARTFGLFASFAPKPFLDQAGNGAHIHLSLWGTPASGQSHINHFFDSSARGGLSQLGKYFIGGILQHIRTLCASF